MKYILIILLAACQSEKPDSNSIYLDLRGSDTIPKSSPYGYGSLHDSPMVSRMTFASLGMYYCCDTIRTFNHTAIVKSVLDSNGVLVRFEIVEVLK